jgi:polysaccharide export outer membrane protein
MRLLYFKINAFLGLVVTILNSCANVNSNAMFKTPRDGSFVYDTLVMTPKDDYIMSEGDRFSFQFATNEGERIIFLQSGVADLNEGINRRMNANNVDYLVRQDGKSNLPLIGEISVKGLTVIKLEDTLTKILSKNFINPFVQIRVSNQRVVVFGGRGRAQVVNLPNTNTSLIEAIAMAGGIDEQGKAFSIKVMRRTEIGKREVYKIDLSTINGLNEADMIVQGNDYIYVDYKPRIASSLLREISPWLSLMTTSLTLFAIFKN